MNLEDHLGDIVRKARLMTGTARPAAAESAGLTESELAALEDTGRWSKVPNWSRLAQAIGLDSAKLERVANGWLPNVPDLSNWRELRCITTSDGSMAVNCYLVWDEAIREAALFDTGWDARPIMDLLAANSLRLRHIFITHGHEDHVAALDTISGEFRKARIHSGSKDAPLDRRNRPSECVQLGSLRITHRLTPGHAEDGTTYLIGNWPEDAPHVAIVGDAIFAGSMGRGNQSWDLARNGVREQILTLPADTLICPGHGPLTTVLLERANNPFF